MDRNKVNNMYESNTSIYYYRDISQLKDYAFYSHHYDIGSFLRKFPREVMPYKKGLCLR